ncbi:4Fe-4S dicluster domain-containing protein [Methanotorris igneus]|uniref:Ferredoxin n=1 Tax=Methanotorris igneus (strain DSM 5666 / JCM 11834 / Kol 5) TaxID=880724 RepID=F6BF44_METIK|nr:4Fe-4S dicluster domain-containing protein [Methanotorris igneus]AEF96914.1 4Fe-4S ferredoxin iron-sulfur binding domain-containing protein [Methanotorris igneus Kol 5]
MNPKIIVLDPSKCSKCNDCINKCAEIHGISRVKKFDGIPIFCMQCETPPCKEICPVDAIYLKENIPIVNKEKCIGCGMCAIACPIGAIFVEEKVAHKCTLCLDVDRITPACIEACKDNALKLVCDESLEMIKEEKRKKLIKIISEKFEEL